MAESTTKPKMSKEIEKLPIATDEFLYENRAPMDYGKFQYEVVKNINFLNKKINEIIDQVNSLKINKD